MAATLSVAMLALTFNILTTVLKQSTDTEARNDTVDQVRLGLAQIDRQVRSSDEMSVVDNVEDLLLPPHTAYGRLIILTRFDSDNAVEQPRCVEWQATGGMLRNRTWPVNWSTAGGVSPWVVTGRGLTKLQRPFTAVSPRLVQARLTVTSRRGSILRPSDLVTSFSIRNTKTTPASCSPVPDPGPTP